jgi:hypothetical protein
VTGGISPKNSRIDPLNADGAPVFDPTRWKGSLETRRVGDRRSSTWWGRPFDLALGAHLAIRVSNPDTGTIQAVWNNMISHVNSGDFVGASSYFSVASSDNYLASFFTVGTANATSAINQIGTLNPVYVDNDRAEYYFI